MSKITFLSFEQPIAELESNAERAASLLKSMGSSRRLLILCQLVEGEKAVGELEKAVGLSQSALSQHLAKMRDEKIVAFRRDAQTVWYHIADPRIEQLFATLHDLFCEKPKTPSRQRTV